MKRIVEMFKKSEYLVYLIVVFSCLIADSRSDIQNNQSNASPNVNKNFIHHHGNKHKSHVTNTNDQNTDFNQQIFINQSNNIHILAKHGQTVYLPCVVFRQRHQDLANVHTIWNKLNDKQRPIVLSIGLQQLKQDMRYRVRSINLNRLSKSDSDLKNNEKYELLENSIGDENVEHLEDNSETTIAPISPQLRHKYLIQNWQFEIRKISFEDAGTYQCLLPLVKPIVKNITLQVIPDLTIEPRSGQFKQDDKIVIKCKATLKYHPKLGHNLNQRQQKPNIHWYKENEIIKTTSSRSTKNDPHKIEIDTRQDQNENLLNSVLTIYNAKVDDSGKYKCIYDNIQEQVDVKVIYDYFEYKNFLTAGTGSKNRLCALLYSIVSLILILKRFL